MEEKNLKMHQFENLKMIEINTFPIFKSVLPNQT